MTKIKIVNDRAFLLSSNIDIFPCSRRGQYSVEDSPKYYDPEARLNTERTNRLHTAINGFTDSFISSFIKDQGKLTFVLAGYRVEVRNFDINEIANKLGATDTIYAHLSLHNNVSLNIPGYYTEILYRQSTSSVDTLYLDITDDELKQDFFVGISFTKESQTKDFVNDVELESYDLALFKQVGLSWELVQSSMLPKVEHGETENSIKVSGDFTVKHGEQTSFKVTEDKTTLGPTEISELDVTGDFTVKQVSDEGEEISFEITKHGVSTVNVPLHITKGTTIDGGVTLNAGVEAFSLIVGAPAGGGELFPEGTIKAKGRIETPTLEATESIKTLALDVKTIKNDGTEAITVDDDLTVTGNLAITTGKAVTTDTVNVNTINSRQENGTIKVGSSIKVTGKATLNNDLEVTGDTALKELTAGETTLNSVTVDNTAELKGTLTVTGKTTVNNDLEVKEGLKVSSNVSAKKIVANELWLEDTEKTTIGQAPALELAHLIKTDTYQLRFKFGTPITIIEE